jgi:hypothetical protein
VKRHFVRVRRIHEHATRPDHRLYIEMTWQKDNHSPWRQSRSEIWLWASERP